MLKKMEYKSWREICGEMGWKTISGCYRDARIKELNSICLWHKVEGKQKIIIDKIYETPLPIVDNRGSNNSKEIKNCLISKDMYNHIGVYKITIDNKIYIGSTISGFRRRFINHYNGCHKSMQYTYEMLQNGAVFEILEDMTGQNEENIREKENEYIQKYKDNDYWIVVNNINGWGGGKYKEIKIEECNYDKALNLLKQNGLL